MFSGENSRFRITKAHIGFTFPSNCCSGPLLGISRRGHRAETLFLCVPLADSSQGGEAVQRKNCTEVGGFSRIVVDPKTKF